MNNNQFMLTVKEQWERLANGTGYKVCHAYLYENYFPSLHDEISLSGFGLTIPDLTHFAREVLKADGYVIRNEALTVGALRAEIKRIKGR